ncbi:MAG: AI-2E family transporter [Verrucomicrobia bacterium]|nr:AI-2E family transporter [Verrucomicrobiota bacterium]
MSARPVSLSTASRDKLSPLVPVIVLVVLYLAREVLIPLALAVLFSFLLGPAVRRLERRGVWRGVAVSVVCSAFFLIFAGIAWIVVNQTVDLAGQLPTYQENISRKLQSLRRQGGGSLNRAAKAVENINKQLQESATDKAVEEAAPNTSSEAPGTSPRTITGKPANPREPPPPPPVAVRVVEQTHSPTEYVTSLLGPLLGPLGTAGIVVVFTIFLLLEAEDLRDRLLHLAGSEQLSVTTQAVNEAGDRVSRYLRMQALINTSFGVAVALGLWGIGVPNAALWGLLATCLRFIPYLGTWIAMALPAMLAFAVYETWAPLVETVAFFALLELILCNFIEPMLFSHSTGVSTVAVVVAATFWTWLWGPVGLLLSTPLTVCIVVLGRYMPRLEFLHTLLGDQPALPIDARLYQRLLAFDQEAVVTLADEELKTHSPAEFYDSALIPTLNQAQFDQRQGRLGDDVQLFIRQTTQALVEDLRERPRASFFFGSASAASNGNGNSNGETDKSNASAQASAEPAAEQAPSCPSALPTRVLILPARNESDEAAGEMLAHLLALDCTGAEVLSSRLLIQETTIAVAERKPALIFISAVRPFAVMHARYLCKRLRAQNPTVKIIIGLWDAKDPALDETGKTNLRASAPADGVATTMAEAIILARDYLPQLDAVSSPAVVPAAAPAKEAAALAAVG